MQQLPTPDLAGRRDRLRTELAELELGALLVTEPVHVRYLSGFSGSNGQLHLADDAGGDRLVTDERYLGRAADECPGLEVVVSRDPSEAATEMLLSCAAAARRLGVEADHLTWDTAQTWRDTAESRDVELVATSGLVAALREVKDDAEVAAIAAACRITVTALAELLDDRAAVGVSERDLATWLERRFVDLGADGVAFPSIVASGPNSAVPHHAPGQRRLVAGDLLTVDCGALVAGYHADCTRTVAIGHLDDELAEVHALVERAQAAGCAAAVDGASSGEVDTATREVIERAGHGDRFVHGTGHGVGLQIHEAPAVAMGASATLRPGTALTVEPGVYLPGVGGVRIEDTIVVTADGTAPRVLTDIPRSLRVL